MDAFGIPLPHKNDEWRFVDDTFLRERVPIDGGESTVLQSLCVAFNREDREMSWCALQNLIRHRLRSRKG